MLLLALALARPLRAALEGAFALGAAGGLLHAVGGLAQGADQGGADRDDGHADESEEARDEGLRLHAGCVERRDCALASGALEAASRAMALFPEEHGVQEEGRWAVHNITAGSQRGRAARVAPVELPPVGQVVAEQTLQETSE